MPTSANVVNRPGPEPQLPPRPVNTPPGVLPRPVAINGTLVPREK